MAKPVKKIDWSFFGGMVFMLALMVVAGLYAHSAISCSNRGGDYVRTLSLTGYTCIITK